MSKKQEMYRSIVVVDDFQYAHRFMDYPGEASYLHGHSGWLTFEIEGPLNEHGFAHAIKEAKKLAWEIADNFHHASVFQEGDPLLDLVLSGYEKSGMKGTTSRFGKPAKKLDHPLVRSYPESRIVVTKKPSSCENMIEIFYELLKDKINIKKMTFRSSSMNASTREF